LSVEQVAPLWHTALFAVFFFALAIGGAILQSHAKATPQSFGQTRQMVPLYLSLIAMEYGLIAFVKGGIARRGISVRDILGGDWSTPRKIATDVAMGLGFWVVWMGVLAAWNAFFSSSAAVSMYTPPRRALEVVLWIAVSISAGISEEFAFRGYLQRQFGALTGSRWIAVVLQAILFGVAHSYEGWRAAIHIVSFGLIFGLIAIWRKSLRPGIVAHAFTDIMAGLFGL
jgi:membrane protease YdiL (CAAX protease family)